MKKLLLTTMMAAGLALSGQAAATPFYLDLSDDSTVNPRGAIDVLGLQYDSLTEVDVNTGAIVSRGGMSLVGYNFNGTNHGFASLSDLVITDDGTIQNTFTYDPEPRRLGEDDSADPLIVVTALTFDFELEGFLNPDGDSITYTGGVLDIWSYQYSFDDNNPDVVTYIDDSEKLLIESEFSNSSINLGEQVVNAMITEFSVTPDGEDTFFFKQGGAYVSFEDYISLVMKDIFLLASQTVTAGELASAIANPIDAITDANDEVQTILIGDDHAVTVKFDVPEPSTAAILGLGLMSVFGLSRRRRK
ncbi:PEP-CTERM sorting domain-containing protein [Alteromonas macleodii]|tara:strand:+ start:2038 stop:2949 length:912 start_codon:yes stop_codon:yes gene_type:complete